MPPENRYIRRIFGRIFAGNIIRMNHLSLAEKMVALRKSIGLSQEALAEQASINLRTLQRIESGETEPRGQTLRLLAKALDKPVEYFLDFTKDEDTSYLQLMNLSTLSFWVIPLGNIFLPLVLWIMKKDTVKGASELGRRIINFQITWTFIVFTLFFTAMLSPWLQLPFYVHPLHGAIAAGVLYVLNSILILIASVQINRGAEKIYSLSVPILR